LYEIHFYVDNRGKQPVLDYLRELKNQRDKSSRIKADKISDYIQSLSEYGTHLGEPYLKHIDGEIWELRPLRDRILFAAWTENGFLLLHVFMKQTQKTPPREIEKAKRELADMKKRGNLNE
jgi:phage-related protein